MTVQIQPNNVTDILVSPHKKWDKFAAHWISQIASPPVLMTVTAILGAATLSTTEAWRWALIYSFIAVMLPLLYVVWLLKHGKVTDLHLVIRAERIKPLIFSLICAGFVWGMMQIYMAPNLLLVLAALNFMQTTIFLAITFYWKISAHSAAASILALVVLYTTGLVAILILGIIPLVAWARIHLSRHTLMQTIAGAGLGSLIFSLAVLIYS